MLRVPFFLDGEYIEIYRRARHGRYLSGHGGGRGTTRTQRALAQ